MAVRSSAHDFAAMHTAAWGGTVDLVSLLIVLVIVGAALYLVSVLPIDATVKTVIRVLVIVFVVVWALRQLAGYLPAL